MRTLLRRAAAALLTLMMLCPGAMTAEESARPALTEEQLLSYYDGAVFIGDSITGQLYSYVLRQRESDPDFMKNTKFYTADSYFLYAASRKYLLNDVNNLSMRGVEMPLWELVGVLQPRRVLILLGVNDYAGSRIEKNIGYCERILDLIGQSAPDAQVIFESLTPVRPAFCRGKDYRTQWDQYNAALEEMCLRRGAGYVDIASALKDEDGYLRKEYSSDGEYHLSRAGLRVWLDSLIRYARAQYESGLWTPQE